MYLGYLTRSTEKKYLLLLAVVDFHMHTYNHVINIEAIGSKVRIEYREMETVRNKKSYEKK